MRCCCGYTVSPLPVRLCRHIPRQEMCHTEVAGRLEDGERLLVGVGLSEDLYRQNEKKRPSKTIVAFEGREETSLSFSTLFLFEAELIKAFCKIRNLVVSNDSLTAFEHKRWSIEYAELASTLVEALDAFSRVRG